MHRRRLIANAAIMHLWQKFRITYRPIVAIVADMAADGVSFEEALEAWAEGEAIESVYGCWPASRWRSEICYRILKGDGEVPGSLEAWFEARVEEVRAIADGVRS